MALHRKSKAPLSSGAFEVYGGPNISLPKLLWNSIFPVKTSYSTVSGSRWNILPKAKDFNGDENGSLSFMISQII
jgi:hypothetical protein